MPGQFNYDPSFFDVGYGVVTTPVTNGTVIITTTGADYHGVVLVTSATNATVRIYDSTGTTAGNLLDAFVVTTTSNYRTTLFTPTKAKKGIVISVTGAGASGSVYFAPKG